MNRIARNMILTVKRAVTAVAALCLLMAGPLYAQVNANFTASVVSGCSPLTVTFTDLSTGNVHAWFWDFGNGNTSTFDDVIATYTTPGTYTVSLTVRDTLNGFSSTKTEVAYIRVYADPAANFSANQTAGCAPFNVNFTDLSTSADGAIDTWLWDFGDGNISNSPNPSHTYLTAGTYTVTLVVQDVNGCQNTFIRPSLISVTEVADLDFTALPRTGCAAPLVVDFTSILTPAGNYTYLWDFGDGVTSTDANPTHIYTLNGDYAVTLTITDINGCQEQLVKNNYVLINTPVAAFSALDTAICVGQPLQLLNSSTGSDGFAWTFGDGNTSNQQNPSHTYTIPGTYSISLTASNSAGCSDIEGRTNYITVYPAPGAAFGSTDNTGCQSPMFVTFNDQSAGNIIAWDWNFGNGDFSNGPNPTTTYTLPGSYDVSLTVTTADGCQATEVIPNYILFSEPDAEFALSTNQGCVPLTVSFADLSSSQADPIVSWLWNFGDGNISLLPNPVNVYLIPGQYTVTLTVVTQSGCRNTETFQYVEAGTRPNVNFTATPRLACVNQDIQFADLSTGGATRWFWGFGDGTGSTLQNPTHAYVDTGYFSVSLIVDYLGCRDTLVIDSLVRIVGPLADFQMTPAAGCDPPLPVSFFDQSAGATSWFWDFGNGTTSTLQNPTQIFASTGTFEINLVVTDSITGCVNTVNQSLTITDPQAGFSVSDQRGCAPMTVDFTNSSVQASNFFWDFGDGALSTDPNPSHDYLTPGSYTVQLIATDGTCSDTLVMQNVIRVIGPQPDFSVNQFSGCAPLPVRFTDLTVADPLAPIVNWIWDFGDGNTGSGPGPNHTYTAAGSYHVSLTVLDAEGCISTIQKLSYVSPTQPQAAFTTADSLACPGSLVRFTNLSTGVGLSYFWNFGDGTTSTVPNPIKLFAPNASYTITLTVTDVNGCTDSEIKVNYVTVAQPIAAFAADVTSATCPPLSVNFTDQSSPNVVSWYWDFGDGSTSTLRNPSKVYAVAGQYDVMLIVTTALNCRDTMRMDNLINISGPTGSFSLAPNTGCEPLTVAFTANSPNPLWTYNWDFGDGTGATGTNVNHTYVQDTTVNPLLLIRDAGGCIVAIQSPSSIVIRPQPNPSFLANRNEVCLGQSVSFSNTSTSERTITGYIWDFGDGSTSTLVNPTHVYTDTGFYTVTLTAFTVDGCSSTSTTPVTIHVTGLPTAFFVVTPSEECVPANMVFTDASTSSYPLANWQWDFGDGGIATGQTILPHTYLTAGVFNATLTVTDNRGCTGAATRSVRVNPLPTVAFTSSRYGCAPITISFSDQSAGSSPVIAWEWNFGDGTSSTLQNPVKTYASDGNYSITLTVTDSKGCRNSLTRVNYIQLERPIANFTSTARTTCPPQRVRFTDQSIPDTTITWLWNFGDGNTSTQQNPTYTYSDPGTYTVTLIVTNIFGCSDTFVRPNHVRVQQPPLAAFNVSDSSNCVPENIIFTSSSVALGAPISTYQWNFGTGSGASGPAASFLYTVAGNYTSRLIVRDANGCRDTAYKTIYIHPNPDANFIAGDTVGCAVANIAFTDLTTGVNAPVTWDWTFGDGQVGSSQNPVNTYFNDGVYDVKLVVTDINGCTDSITRNNYITLDHPSADFSTSRLTACPGTTVFFTDQSTGPFPAVNWYWNFGDGSPAGNQQNPTHIYTVPGTYSVSLIVTDAIGCRDTLVRSLLVEVYVPPTSNFSYGPTQGCDPLTVTFTNGSSSGTAAIVNYLWNFGDGGTSVVPNPSYVYNTPGSYTVSLTVTDANGCSSVRQQNVQVLQVPNVNFIADRRYSCAPQIINFTDLTTTPYVKVSWLWSFGDGNTSTSPAPSHAYLADGTYTVKLVVTDQNGCKDSVTKANYIRLSHPVANFSMDNASVCPNVPVGVRFTDLSVPDTTLMSWLWDFGDGTTSTLQNPTHSYATPGNYSITLTVTNVLGCSDSYTLGNAINVLDPPVTNFAKSDSANCTPLSINFTDLSTPGESAIVGWNWNFGN
ncbi:MAG: PKD domain-containing protein, partial [Bacteroidetes bacterium]